MECDILYNLLLLVHITLWKGDVLLSLQVKLGSISITPPHPPHRPAIGLNVDHITHPDLFFGD